MADNQLKIGGLVEATAFRGEILRRRVVEIVNQTVYICREDEWQKAAEERREPEAVGFKMQNVRPVAG
jgi:hypothetical protein